MSLQERITAELKAAMVARNTERTNALRLVKSALMYAAIGRPAEQLSDDETLAVLRKEAKKRRDAIDEYAAAGRAAQAAQEESELAIINEFLPKGLSPEELEALVRQAITETGATSKKDMGVVMKAVQAKVAGRADGKAVSGVVSRLLV